MKQFRITRTISPTILKSLALLKQQTLDILEPKILTPNDNYFVIARSYDHFRAWARRFALSTSTFRYINELYQSYGWANYHLVVLPGHNFSVDDMERLVQQAYNIYHTNLYYPVAETGKIVRWVEFKNGRE